MPREASHYNNIPKQVVSQSIGNARVLFSAHNVLDASMPPFSAINVEPEENVEEEIDPSSSKELLVCTKGSAPGALRLTTVLAGPGR